MSIEVKRDGQTIGSFTLEQLSELLAAGELTPDDRAFHQPDGEWLPLSAFPGIELPQYGVGRGGAESADAGEKPKLPPLIKQPDTGGLPPIIASVPGGREGDSILRITWGGWFADLLGTKIRIRFGTYENEFLSKKPFEIDLPCMVGQHHLEVKLWIRSAKLYPIQIDSPGFYLVKLRYDAFVGNFESRIFLTKMN